MDQGHIILCAALAVAVLNWRLTARELRSTTEALRAEQVVSAALGRWTEAVVPLVRRAPPRPPPVVRSERLERRLTGFLPRFLLNDEVDA
jgi:hypothetical protein